MDIVRIGKFLQELRRDKGITQEQLAEQMGVARRTISRGETGSNMPDLDLLMELSDFYAVDLREILNGERETERMNEELKKTVLQVAEYSNEEKQRSSRIMKVYFAIGLLALVINAAMGLMELEDTFWVGFLEGATWGLAFVAMALGMLNATGRMEKLRACKKRLFGIGQKGQ